MQRGATLSGCRVYRYCLFREWDQKLGTCVFIMLNPSTADAEKDDPTVRRCIGFAQRWGYGCLLVYNLFALRATDPRALKAHPDPVGPGNDAVLAEIPEERRIVAAWGSWGDHLQRALHVRRMFRGRLWCLGTTNGGHPRHPLYVRADQELRQYRMGDTL